jgi:hypothetical protein
MNATTTANTTTTNTYEAGDRVLYYGSVEALYGRVMVVTYAGESLCLRTTNPEEDGRVLARVRLTSVAPMMRIS